MSHYHYKMAAPVKFLDTCYDLSSHKTVEIPKVSFVFKGGVELELDVKATVIPVTDSDHVVCFAFAPNSVNAAGAILRNIMQRTVQVVYDVEGRKVGVWSCCLYPVRMNLISPA
ncbi:hypothetical protein LWI28_005867 [Acer negundo]|uniref:Peptidase A1 domain-containing protein n=1 Tax=Acer negundo TaxID=4023 RepID=A0AAD5P042_ACENE|nr:hypothetical protein LWI28_005867 [Acer negundo]